MNQPRVAAVTIGQAPRPDLLEPLLARTGDGFEVLEYGALDGLAADRLPRTGAEPEYPLTTRLRDGSRVTVEEADLAPLVQAAVDRAEEAGVDVTLLLCAGGFSDVTARRALVRPFDAAVARLRAGGARRVAVVIPHPGQAGAARRKFEAAGFDVTIVVGDPSTVEILAGEGALDAIVLDYVGHPSSAVQALRRRTDLPVIDLGEAGAEEALAQLALDRIAAAPGTR